MAISSSHALIGFAQGKENAPMNRMFSTFMVSFVVCAITSSTLTAQTATLISVATASADKTNAPKVVPTGTIKVATINIGVIFSKYEKALSMKEEMAQELK